MSDSNKSYCAEKIRVLIADKVQKTAASTKMVLKQYGFKMFEIVIDGKTADELYEEAIEKNEPYGLIISDWELKGMKGIEFVKKIRYREASNEELPKTKIILTSESSEGENIKKAMFVGVDSFIVKPYTANTLLNSLEKIYGK